MHHLLWLVLCLLHGIRTRRRITNAKVPSLKWIFVLIFICCLLQDENLSCRRGGNTSTWDSGIGGLSSISNMASQFEGELAAMNSNIFQIELCSFRVWNNFIATCACWIISVNVNDSVCLTADPDSVCLEPDSLSHSREDLQEGVQFSVWVSFYEIYNEFLYDLLDISPSMQPRKRVTLRLSDDKQGNPYVKGKMNLLKKKKYI